MTARPHLDHARNRSVQPRRRGRERHALTVRIPFGLTHAATYSSKRWTTFSTNAPFSGRLSAAPSGNWNRAAAAQERKHVAQLNHSS